jgi:phosphohistidine phosphatase SixA
MKVSRWIEILAGIVSWAALTLALVSATSLLGQSASSAASDEIAVILLRHADAPGRGEPHGFILKECATQRNLSERGRDDARALGAKLRASAVAIDRVVSSEWCRARETAELMNVGAVEDAPAFDDLTFYPHRINELLDGERRLIEAWRGPGILLVVTHSSNIAALTHLDMSAGAMVAIRARQGLFGATPFAVASENYHGELAGVANPIWLVHSRSGIDEK